MIRAIPSRDCLDCPSPAAPGHDLCESCHLRRLDEERDAAEERACAVLDDREGL